MIRASSSSPMSLCPDGAVYWTESRRPSSVQPSMHQCAVVIFAMY